MGKALESHTESFAGLVDTVAAHNSTTSKAKAQLLSLFWGASLGRLVSLLATYQLPSLCALFSDFIPSLHGLRYKDWRFYIPLHRIHLFNGFYPNTRSSEVPGV